MRRCLFGLEPSFRTLSLSLDLSPSPSQVGNHIDVLTGKWVAQDSGIGAGVDSYFEYLVKGAILLQDKKLMAMFLGKKGGVRRLLPRLFLIDMWFIYKLSIAPKCLQNQF